MNNIIQPKKRNYESRKKLEGTVYYQECSKLTITCRTCGKEFTVDPDAYKPEHCIPCLIGVK